MCLETQIINPINSTGWNELVLSHKDTCLFHSSQWAQLLKNSYRYNPIYFVLKRNQKLIGFIPIMEIKQPIVGTRGVSLPFTDCCCPVIDEAIHFQTIFNEVLEKGRKYGWKYIEIRGGKYLSHQLQAPPYTSYYLHRIDNLRGIKLTKKYFRGSTIRNTKKAIKNGVRTEVLYTADSIKEFYKLNCITRKYHGIPPQPYFFFEEFYKHIISKRFGFVVLAKFNNKIIAGAIYLLFGKKAVYKYGASDRKYQFLRANNLVMWKAIEWCANNEYESFCMGRTELYNSGLAQFKEGFGTRRSKINYYRYNISQNRFETKVHSRFRLLSKTSKSLPIPLLKLIGNLAYKYIG